MIKKKNFKPLYAGILTVTLLGGSVITPSYAGASTTLSNENMVTNQQELPKPNITKETSNGIEYTYSEDSNSYRVEMTYNQAKTEVVSKVYLLKPNGEEEFVRESSLKIGQYSTNLQIKQGGEVTNHQVGEEVREIRNKINEGIAPMSYSDLTNWQYSATYNYREDIPGMTQDAIVGLLVGAYNFPVGAAMTAAGLVNAATSDAFWIKDMVSYKYIKGTKLPRGEQSVKTVFADKANNYFLYGPEITYTYASGYAP